jgi:hypothetical protein
VATPIGAALHNLLPTIGGCVSSATLTPDLQVRRPPAGTGKTTALIKYNSRFNLKRPAEGSGTKYTAAFSRNNCNSGNLGCKKFMIIFSKIRPQKYPKGECPKGQFEYRLSSFSIDMNVLKDNIAKRFH